MTLALSAPMSAEVAERFTQPGWLLEIDESWRISTLGDVTAMDLPWTAAPFDISGLGSGGNLATGGRVDFPDPDGAMAAAMLNGAFKAKRARVWIAHRGALAAGDPVLRFDGLIDKPSLDFPRRRLSCELVPALPSAVRIPRQYYGPALGLAFSLPAGSVLRVGGKEYRVER